MKRWGVVGILILAFCGLANSMYLAQHKASGTPLICQSLSGCNVVANSQYAYLFGIPIAEFGVLFYGLLFVLAALEFVLFNQLVRRVLQGVALIGVLASLYFILVQIFYIGAFCIYCSVSAVISVLVLVLASFIEPMRTRFKKHSPAPSPAVPPRSLSMPPKT